MADHSSLDTFSDECFRKYVGVIHAWTGITINEQRKSMVQGRIRKRIHALKLSGYEAYLEQVERDLEERTIFIDVITTHETAFFRTQRIWDHITKTFLPNWYKAHPNGTLKAWSAAASTGEEAYSLAILCQEFKAKNPGFTYEVLGTDLSREMVENCRSGVFEGRAIESFRKLSPELFSRYIRPLGGEKYTGDPALLTRLKFQEHNLFKPAHFKEPFDLVLLRNVLIYFNAPDQEKVLANIHPWVALEGTLIIGESESLKHIQTGFEQVEPLIYRRTILAKPRAA